MPRNTPEDVAQKLNNAFYEALQNPRTREAFEASGNQVVPRMSLAELDRLYRAEIERYEGIAKSINLQPQ